MNAEKCIVMTGGTSGFGKVAALRLAARGARMIILSRDVKRSEKLLEDLGKNYPHAEGSVQFVSGNLNSFASVSEACAHIRKLCYRIDELILNAGIMNFKRKLTNDGVEETLQVNLYSHLLMVTLLKDLVKKGVDPRIIFTASALHQGNINFRDLNFEKGFSSFRSYKQSKLGVILCSRYLANEMKDDGILVCSQHPGMVRTNLGRSAGLISRFIFWLLGKPREQGAETLLFISGSKNANLRSGAYYADKKVTKTTPESYHLDVAEELINEARKKYKAYLR